MRVKQKQLLLKENYHDRDLVMLNIQPSMENRIKFNIGSFGEWLDRVGDEFNSIYFFYNGKIGDLKNDTDRDISKWYESTVGIQDGIISIAQEISELHSYFDGLLDSNYKDEDIVVLFKYMISKNYDKFVNLSPDEIYEINVSDKFKEDLLDEKYKIAVPHDLINTISKLRDPLVIGGLKHETVRMFRILFSAVNKEFNIHTEWEY